MSGYGSKRPRSPSPDRRGSDDRWRPSDRSGPADSAYGRSDYRGGPPGGNDSGRYDDNRRGAPYGQDYTSSRDRRPLGNSNNRSRSPSPNTRERGGYARDDDNRGGYGRADEGRGGFAADSRGRGPGRPEGDYDRRGYGGGGGDRHQQQPQQQRSGNVNTVALERAIVEAKNSYRDPRDRERDRFDRDRGRDGPSYGSGGNSSNDGDRQGINSSSSGNDRRDAGELEEGEEREEEGEMRASAAASAAGNSNRDRYNDGAVETVTDRAADDEDNDDGDGLLISSEQDEEERRLAESRARRAAILARKAAENSVSAPTANAAAVISVAVSTNSSSSSSSSALLSSAAPLAASASMAASNGPISASGSSGSKAAAPAPSAASAAKPAITSVGQQKPSQRGSAALLSMFAEDAGDSDYEEEAAVRRPVGGSSGALLAASASSSSIFASTAAEDAAGFAAAGSAVAGRNAAALINADGDGSGEDASGAAGHHGAAVAAAAAAAKRKQPSASSAAAAAASTLSDNWDDAEGYYRTVIGELLDGRYQLLGLRGRGVFSSVVYCRDTKASEAASAAAAEAEGDVDATVAAAAEGTITTAAAPTAIGSAGGIVKQHAALAVGSSTYVAVKIVRSNDTMRRAGLKELDILRQLMTADPTGRYHCVRLLATFEHRNHLCLVFEPLALNLKEVQNKFGKGVGISLVAVRAYAKQLLLSLALLAKLRLIHADIKPHNVLANERYNVIKLADFGSAFREDDPDNEPTPYLVSRFYRAPEIILGYKHSPALDMWSLACCLYELNTGAPLFPGEDNNDMLWRFQCLRGHFPHRMIRYHLRACETLGIPGHFDAELRFRRAVLDPVTKAPVVKLVSVTSPLEDLGAKLSAKRASDDDKRDIAHFKDLLEKMLVLDPAKRIGVREALAHPFIKPQKKQQQPQAQSQH